jgi:hypothetical protein
MIGRANLASRHAKSARSDGHWYQAVEDRCRAPAPHDQQVWLVLKDKRTDDLPSVPFFDDRLAVHLRKKLLLSGLCMQCQVAESSQPDKLWQISVVDASIEAWPRSKEPYEGVHGEVLAAVLGCGVDQKRHWKLPQLLCPLATWPTWRYYWAPDRLHGMQSRSQTYGMVLETNIPEDKI